MQETMTTKRPLFSFSSGRGQHKGRIHAFQLQEGFHSHSRLRSYWRFVLANVKCKTCRMCVSCIPINVWSPVLATTINVLNKNIMEMSQWLYLPTLLRLLSKLNWRPYKIRLDHHKWGQEWQLPIQPPCNSNHWRLDGALEALIPLSNYYCQPWGR